MISMMMLARLSVAPLRFSRAKVAQLCRSVASCLLVAFRRLGNIWLPAHCLYCLKSTAAFQFAPGQVWRRQLQPSQSVAIYSTIRRCQEENRVRSSRQIVVLIHGAVLRQIHRKPTCQHPKNIAFKRHVLGWCMCERNKGSKRRWVRTRPSLRFASR